jgi:hypothetical protein
MNRPLAGDYKMNRPLAALVVPNPDWPPGAGLFDQLATHGGRRRSVGIWVSLAAPLTIASRVALTGPISNGDR